MVNGSVVVVRFCEQFLVEVYFRHFIVFQDYESYKKIRMFVHGH
jgi:hypothetical protein